MAIKSQERKSGCFAKAAENEPIFVLRAQDNLAPELIREWAYRARYHGCPKEKTDEALKLADLMAAWPNRKYPD